MKVPDELVEAVAEAIYNEREFRDPTGEQYGDPADESAPREPYLWETMVAEGKYEGDQDEYRKDARAALEAVLPKVRERLLSASAREAGFRAAGQRVPWQEKPTPEALGQALKLGQEAAFDHAFPEEGSRESGKCRQRHLLVKGFKCSCGWTAPAGSADIDDIDMQNPPQEGS